MRHIMLFLAVLPVVQMAGHCLVMADDLPVEVLSSWKLYESEFESWSKHAAVEINGSLHSPAAKKVLDKYTLTLIADGAAVLADYDSMILGHEVTAVNSRYVFSVTPVSPGDRTQWSVTGLERPEQGDGIRKKMSQLVVPNLAPASLLEVLGFSLPALVQSPGFRCSGITRLEKYVVVEFVHADESSENLSLNALRSGTLTLDPSVLWGCVEAKCQTEIDGIKGAVSVSKTPRLLNGDRPFAVAEAVTAKDQSQGLAEASCIEGQMSLAIRDAAERPSSDAFYLPYYGHEEPDWAQSGRNRLYWLTGIGMVCVLAGWRLRRRSMHPLSS